MEIKKKIVNNDNNSIQLAIILYIVIFISIFIERETAIIDKTI